MVAAVAMKRNLKRRNEKNHRQTLEKVEGTLWSVLEVGGFGEQDEPLGSSGAEELVGPRRQLVQTLRRLLSMMQDPRLHEERMSPATGAYLQDWEDLCRRARQCVPIVQQATELDQSDLADVKFELLDHTTSVEFSPWVLLGLTATDLLKDHLRQERVAIERMDSVIDKVFVNSQGSCRAIDDTINLLGRYEVLESSQFRAILDHLLKEKPAVASIATTFVNQDTIQGQLRDFQRASPRSRPVHSAENVVLQFVRTPVHRLPPSSAILVVGAAGYGKTHLCDQTERWARHHKCMVVRPNLPIDFLGPTVGQAEDALVALLGVTAEKAVILLDNLDSLFDDASFGNSRSTEPHVQRRCWSTFLAVLDSFAAARAPHTATLVLCTSRESSLVQSWRFDGTYFLDLPDATVRKAVIAATLDSAVPVHPTLESLLETVAQSTAGMSYAEVLHLCRQAFQSSQEPMRNDVPDDGNLSVLHALHARLSSHTPASLRDGALDSFVDARILSGADLTMDVREGEFMVCGDAFPFAGGSAAYAWKHLETSIVIPLCRSIELRELLDGTGRGERRALTGGLLLAGPTCSGKSALALHCAKYAATLLPTVKVLEVPCTSLIHKELGGSEQAVHRLFEAVRKASPCLLILDGLENVATVRGHDATTEGTMDRVLSSLLIELDGVDAFANDGGEPLTFAVIGITPNEAWIDPAIKRPGRLEKTIRLSVDWT